MIGGLVRQIAAGGLVAAMLGGVGTAVAEPAASMPLGVEATRRLGWDPAGLAKVLGYTASLSTDALVIATGGQVVATMGDLQARHDIHSARKSLLSALIGQHAGTGPGRIPLDATLAELGVGDAPVALTPLQRQATVNDLLKSMSGINHAAAAEAGMLADKNRRLGHGENRPGTIWAYNNWDYNALTTIFETRTGLSVAEAFGAGIATPLGMRDFTPDDVRYIAEPALSRHRAAMFRMSARDLLRFGELYLDKGMHDGRRLLPEGWVERITSDFATTGRDGLTAGHGDMWWIPDPATGLPAGSFWAMGIGSQALFVVPAWRTVIVHQSDTAAFWRRLRRSTRDDGLSPDAALERLLLSCLEPAAEDIEYCRNDRFILRREFSRLVALIAAARR